MKPTHAKALATIRGDFSPKSGAIDCGVSYQTFMRWVQELGYRRMYVSDAERAAVMRMREGGGMSEELFAPESVAMDSPRLAWLKSHGFETEQLPDGGVECPESGDMVPHWVCRVLKPSGQLYNSREIAGGDTADEACRRLARARGIRLWNEEGA